MTALLLEAPLTPERRRPRLQLRQLAQERRTHAQEARQYAELWYQALLAWRVEYGRPRVPVISYQAMRDHRQGISTLGEFLPDRPNHLRLPSGDYLETEVGQIISTMLTSSAFEVSENGHLLDALRDLGQRRFWQVVGVG